ncbi:SIMPL domain-containing protein [Luteipulveratus mongoliensis]|uniref:SIMPL domain-containing protein n=1 Tax=Luteipulveratus mongoliensis TaxID=571913 RepID=UPI00069753B9|nr:SIMPL domain-containing protein [Luteipulveratus mongoliensis]
MTAPDHSITVIGTGSAADAPDIVRLVMAARAEARDVSTALDTCQQSAVALSTSLREQGVEDRDLRTLGVSVDTRWGQDGVPSGYEATHRFSVTWREPGTVGTVLSKVASAVGNAFRLESLGLAVDDETSLADRARQAAYADAHRQVTALAELAGRSLGQVLAIDQPGARGGPGPEMRFAMAAGDGGVEQGQHTVKTQLQVRWALD